MAVARPISTRFIQTSLAIHTLNAGVETVGIGIASGIMLHKLNSESELHSYAPYISSDKLSLAFDFLAYYGIVNGLMQATQEFYLMLGKGRRNNCIFISAIRIVSGLCTAVISLIYKFLNFIPLHFLFLTLALNAIIKGMTEPVSPDEWLMLDDVCSLFSFRLLAKILEPLSFMIQFLFNDNLNTFTSLCVGLSLGATSLFSISNTANKIKYCRENLPHPENIHISP